MAGQTIVEIPEIAESRTTSTGTGITTYVQGGSTTGICRLPANWDDESMRGGFAIDVRGSNAYPGHYGARTSNIYVHRNPGSRADGLGEGWRLLPLYAQTPYSNFGTSRVNSCLFAQRGGKYLYRAVYAARGDGWSGPTLHIARMGGPQDRSYLVAKQYQSNDLAYFSPVFTVPEQGGSGFVTDHRYPWIWFQNGNEVVWFRDTGEPLGFHYHRIYWTNPVPNERYVGRGWAGQQDYSDAFPPVGTPDYNRMLYRGLTLVSPWSTGDLAPPELWWFMKDTVDGVPTGSVTIYRSSWLEGQAVRTHPEAWNYYGMRFQDVDEYAEVMAQHNPLGMAFERQWLDDEHVVGRFDAGGGWVPPGTPSPGTWAEGPASIRVIRHPLVRDSLTMVLYFASGPDSSWRWRGIVALHSRDDGKTWGRPYVPPAHDGPEDVYNPTYFQGCALLDNGQPIVPVRWKEGGVVAVMAPECVQAGIGSHDARASVYRRTDLNMAAWT